MKKHFLRLLFSKRELNRERNYLEELEEKLMEVPTEQLEYKLRNENLSEKERVVISKILMSRSIIPF